MIEDKATQEALLADLLCLADSKWVLGHWYAKIILNGRSVPDFTSMAAMAQDELGHTRAMFRFLEQVYSLPEFQLEFGRSDSKIHSMTLLDAAPDSWADFVVTAYLAEVAMFCVMETFSDGNYAPTATMLTKFCEEGYFHRLYIEGWIEALGDDERKDAIAALDKRLPLALAWFHAGDAEDLVLKSGARTASWSDAETLFREGLSGWIADVGGSWPDAAATDSWDVKRHRETGSVMPASLWEYVVPTTEEAKMARRPLATSVDDNIDLFDKPMELDGTEPFFVRAE